MSKDYVSMVEMELTGRAIVAPYVLQSEIGNAPIRWATTEGGDYVLQWLDTDMVTWREVPFVRGKEE